MLVPWLMQRQIHHTGTRETQKYANGDPLRYSTGWDAKRVKGTVQCLAVPVPDKKQFAMSQKLIFGSRYQI